MHTGSGSSPRWPRRGWWRLLGGSCLAVAAIACATPTLDSADLEASSRKVRASVEESRRVAFDDALRLVREASSGAVPGTEAFPLDGMDAAAVFAEAARIETRREIVWFEEIVRHNQEVLDTSARLARFEVVTAVVDDRSPDGRLRLEITVHNGLDLPIEAAWLATEVDLGHGERATSSEYVAFRPAVAAGASGAARLVVAGDAARYLFEAAAEQITYRFSSLQSAGEVVLEEITPQAAEKARTGVAEAEARLAELRATLDDEAGPG